MRLEAVSAAVACLIAFASSPSPVAGQRTQPSPCRYEKNCECAAPGITLRWKAAYCMHLEATDDLDQAGVRRCLARPDPPSIAKLGPCDQNAHWKSEICRFLNKKAKDARKCLHDRKFVPRFVESGEGS